MRKLVKKKIFLKVIGIVSISSKLLKTVGPLAVCLDLAKLRLKKRKEKAHFGLKSEYHFSGQKFPFFSCYNELKLVNYYPQKVTAVKNFKTATLINQL